MKMQRTFDRVLQRPVISEKSYATISAHNRYVFRCHPAATKIDIRHAVEAAFSVKVVSVNVVRITGKTRRRSRGGARVIGQSPNWKKAYVTLAPGQKIEGLFAGV